VLILMHTICIYTLVYVVILVAVCRCKTLDCMFVAQLYVFGFTFCSVLVLAPCSVSDCSCLSLELSYDVEVADIFQFF
jgi:hypothetical protein